MDMRFALMISQLPLWASLGTLRGSWEVPGHLFGVFGVQLESLGVLGCPSGVALGAPEVSRGLGGPGGSLVDGVVGGAGNTVSLERSDVAPEEPQGVRMYLHSF